jgi:hypothetical protein
MNFDDCVWMMTNLLDGSESFFEREDAACLAAEQIVGNASATHPSPDIRLYGYGDGNTVVLVRKIPREFANHMRKA